MQDMVLSVPIINTFNPSTLASAALQIWTLILKAQGQVALAVKKPPASAGDTRDAGSIPGSGRSAGGGHGHLLQYSCLENPMDRGARWATVHGAADIRTQTRLK